MQGSQPARDRVFLPTASAVIGKERPKTVGRDEYGPRKVLSILQPHGIAKR